MPQLRPLSLAVLSGSAQAPSLRIVSAGPTGDLARLADAEQVRIVFSEPMIASGTIPRKYRAALDPNHASGGWHFLLVRDKDPHLFA